MAIAGRDRTGAGWLDRLDPIQLVKGKVPENLLNLIYGVLTNLIDHFNGQISLGTGANYAWAGNLDAQTLEVVSPATPGEKFSVPHGLDRLPIGYDVIRRDQAGIVYDDGPGDWGLDVVYLRCNIASMSFVIRLY